ncbi:MAG: hypothetical protein Q7T78_16990 [Rhodoferax sp.]|nr:hypothetical protein [Rhodoferax sp.]
MCFTVELGNIAKLSKGNYMARFIIRVLLHDATREHYEQLEQELAVKHITDVIVGGDGVAYRMPPAEYQCHGDLTAADVRSICVTAASTTGRKHAVLVSQYDNAAWIGLTKA